MGTRFLAKSIYLDGEGVRAGVEQFMINSFEGVNTMCTKVSPCTRALQQLHDLQTVDTFRQILARPAYSVSLLAVSGS